MKKRIYLRLMVAVACILFGSTTVCAQQAYAVLSDDSKTVTFYYDTQKSIRGGMEINNSYSSNPYESATTAIFDDSFSNYRPTSTA